MFKRLFGYPSSSKKASASASIPRSPASGSPPAPASGSPPAPASAPESSLPGRDDADLGRALFDALLAEPRLTAAKLTGSFVPKLTAHPARVPADLEKALRATLASHLNDPDADDDRVREACLHLLSTLALEPSNADFVLAALRDLDQTFERAFEREELYADAAPASNAPSSSSSSSSRHPPPRPRQLHAHLLRALLRCLGGQFTAFDLLEMSRDRADLAVAAALECVESASPPHATRPDPGDLPRLRAHACRLLHELTTPDAHFAEGERDAGIASLAAHFKRRCGDILRAALEGNALERLTRALAPALAEDVVEAARDDDDAASSAIRAARNMLLYSDERSAQLRKAMTRSDLARAVLEPFLERAVDRAVKAANEDEDAAEDEEDAEEYFERGGGATTTTTTTRGDDASRRENDAASASASASDSVSAIRHVCEALSALVAATYKTGALRQRALVSGDDASGRGPLGAAFRALVPGGVLAEPSLASSLAVVDALCRLACNLGVGPGDRGGGDAAAEGRARWRRALEASLGRLDDASARVLATRFAAEVRSLPTDRSGKTNEWIAGMLPAPTAAREEVEEAMRVDRGGNARRRRRRGRKGMGGDGGGGDGGGGDGGGGNGGGGNGGGNGGGGSDERKKERKRDQRRRRRKREADAKKARANADAVLAARERASNDERARDGEPSASAAASASASAPAHRVVSVDAAVVVRVGARVDPSAGDESQSDDGESSDASSDVGDSFGFAGVRRDRDSDASSSAAASSGKAATVAPARVPPSTMSIDALLEEIDAMGL